MFLLGLSAILHGNKCGRGGGAEGGLPEELPGGVSSEGSAARSPKCLSEFETTTTVTSELQKNKEIWWSRVQSYQFVWSLGFV